MEQVEPVVARSVGVEDFTEFVREHEAPLRRALIAVYGGEVGREAACEALAYGWEHWDRIRPMENPVGYLYKVGRTHGRRVFGRREPLFSAEDLGRIPDVEPGLAVALANLSERQRGVVILVNCYQWSLGEVGEMLGLSKTTVQNHLERGMASLRRQIGAFT